MNNFEELQSYQPDYYKEFLEMIEILKAEGVIFDNIEADNIEIRNNFIILTMDVATTLRWERFLGISFDPSQTLDDRRKSIYNLLNPEKMSKTFIQNIFIQYTSFTPDVIFEDSTIKITYVDNVDVSRNLASIFEILNQRKPVHLGLLISIFTKWQQEQVSQGFVNGSVTNEIDFVLSDDIILQEELLLRDRIGHFNDSVLNGGDA